MGTAAWVQVAPAGGLLASGVTQVATVSITTAAATLPVGAYDTVAVFSNTVSGAVHRRTIALAALPYPEEDFACYDFDTDPGWTTEGQWAYGDPLATASHCNDPNTGHTGTNIYGYNLAGD